MGIVKGYDGAFRPNDLITRQEAAAVLVRAAAYFDMDVTNEDTLPFVDRAVISEWALPSVKEAWSAGFIQGDGLRFNPLQSTTRAEAAVMVGILMNKSFAIVPK